jgi:molecular chaperone GrpE (heat shock protein)
MSGSKIMAGPESVARAAFTGAGVALAIVAVLHGSGAFAQGLGPARTATENSAITPVSASTSLYDGATLNAFVQAARHVSALRDKYMPRIAAANIAERSERAFALFDEMRARMHDAIDVAGLGVETYEAISAASARDAALRSRIEAIMNGGASAPAARAAAPQAVTSPAASPSDPMARARQTMDAAAARREVEDLQRRIAAAENRLQAERRQAARDLANLKARHQKETEALTAELAARPSLEDAMEATHALSDVSVSLARTEGERVTLRREVAHLTRSLDTAVGALAELEADLAQATGTGLGQPFTRLEPEPVLFAGSASGLSRGLVNAQPNTVLQARLDAAQTRTLTLQAAHAAQRAALQREISRITDDLRATLESLSALEAGLAQMTRFRPRPPRVRWTMPGS